MLELQVLPGLQLLEELRQIRHADFDCGARLPWLRQDREVEEIISIFKVIVCILWTQQCKEDFPVAGDLLEPYTALEEPGHGIGKILEARDADELSLSVDFLHNFQILAEH